MQKRPLGRTDLMVPVICLGTMTWGEQNSEADGHAQMDYALDHGVDFFDTAEIYAIPPKAETQGATERIIGTWLKARQCRDRIILASKVCGRNDAAWMRKDGATPRLVRQQMIEALEGSLTRLQTDYLDLYQLHAPDRSVSWGSNPTRFNPAEFKLREDEARFEEVLETLHGFVKAGKVRHIGVSNESAWGIMRFLAESDRGGLPRIVSVQNAYNLLNRTYETALAEIWLREQVGLLAYSPLAQGYLTGKYLGGQRPPGARTSLFNRGQRYEKPGAEAAIAAYCALAREFSLEPATLAQAFVLSRPFVTANIIGATNMDQLKLAIDAAHVRLSPELAARIDAIHQLHGNPSP